MVGAGNVSRPEGWDNSLGETAEAEEEFHQRSTAVFSIRSQARAFAEVHGRVCPQICQIRKITWMLGGMIWRGETRKHGDCLRAH